MSGAVTAAAIGGGIAAAGGIAGSAISANAAGNAADVQAQAAQNAAQLQYQASQNALGFQQQQWQQEQQNLAPWLGTGSTALSNLGYLLGITPMSGGAQSPTTGTSPVPSMPGTPMRIQPGIAVGNGPGYSSFGTPSGSPNGVMGTAPGVPLPSSTPTGSPVVNPGQGINPNLGAFGSLMKPYGQTFQAPTDITEQNDPGYQARLKLGTDAIERSAAARGGVLTGGTAKDLNRFAQDYASNEYGNVYNRAFNNYALGYNQYEQNQQNQYNRLASLAGVGQQTAGQLGYLGQNAANSVSSNLLGTAAQMGQQYNNAAAATASGYVGSANAWANGISGIGNNLSNLYLLNQMNGGGGSYSGLSPGTISNPAIANYLANNGATPGYTDWSGIGG